MQTVFDFSFGWTKRLADLTFWTMTKILTHSVLKLNTAESYGKAIEPCICEIWARRVFSKLWGDYFSTENCIFLTIVHPSLLQLQIPAKWILIINTLQSRNALVRHLWLVMIQINSKLFWNKCIASETVIRIVELITSHPNIIKKKKTNILLLTN